MSATPTAIPEEAPPTATALRPASTGRRVVAWLIDIVIVAALVGVVYLLGLIKINGCDTWDQNTQQFGGSCPFESTREVTRPDGSVDVVYVLDSGRELPADHPTVKTALLGTRIVDPPSPATYLVGLGYVLVVYVVVQGGLGWTPGKLLAGVRLARDDGRRPGIPGAFVRWLVIDGVIGLFGVLMGLIDGWWPLRLLAADAAVLLVGGVVALVAGGRQPGDRLARTLVVDEAVLALRRASMPATAPSDAAAPDTTPPEATPTGPTPWAPAGSEGAGTGAPAAAPAGAAAAAAGATFVAGQAGPPEQVAEPAPVPSEAATGPTPLPQWPTSPPDQAAEGQPAAPAGTTGQDAATPTAEPAPTSVAAPADASPPAPATPLGASVGAAPSALRPRPVEEPAEQPQVGEPATEAGAPATTEPATTEPATTEPATTEPATTEPATTEPATTEPATTEPATTEPATTEPATTEPATTEPATTEPATTEEPEPDALVTSVGSGGPASTTEAGDQTGEAATGPPARQPEWDEARRAYIFWDDSRQEWLQYFDDTQSWGPITRA